MKAFVKLEAGWRPLRLELSLGIRSASVHAEKADATTVPPSEDAPDPEYSLYTVEGLIDQARAEISNRLGNADSHDAKSLAVAAAEAAAFFALATFHDHLDRFWWALGFGVVASICCLLMVVRNREFPVGPEVGRFYERHVGEHPLAVALALLTDLRLAVDGCLASLRPKERWWRLGMLLLGVTALGGATYLLAVH